MLRVLDELCWVLRREGFAISTAQTLDVMRVVELVGFADRASLRDAIGCVIVERRADLARYRRVFDEFFALGSAHPGDLFGRLAARGFSPAELDALRQLLTAAAERSGEGSDAQALLGLLGSESELDHLLLAAGIARALAPMTSPLQTGFFSQKVMERLDVPRAASALKRLRDVLREALGEERGAALAKALGEELDHVRRRVRDHVDRSIARRLDPDASERPEGRRKLGEALFTGLNDAEVEEVRRAVRALGERLRGAERVRRRRARSGKIDPHRTLRQSFRTGGVPFLPARRRRRRDKPRLLLLCDVSDSVRTAALFMLELTSAAQELFSNTRSFVFVGDLGETTALFSGGPVGRALAEIYGGGVVDTAHNSNYGRVLSAFEALVGHSVDRRTTVVILGDGRTNYLPDEADVVRRLRDRSRALLWICPESPATWGSGDSAMLRYAAASTKVLVARNARELEIAAREVAARRR
ncbi:MAG: VWA domain-containing protein [Byssovorax sp.]